MSTSDSMPGHVTVTSSKTEFGVEPSADRDRPQPVDTPTEPVPAGDGPDDDGDDAPAEPDK